MRRPDLGIIALAIIAGACAVPTESPNWDMTWNVPVPDKGKLNIGVATFLPPGVTLTTTTPAAFRATIAAAPPIARTLGAQCPACPNATAQKPSFTAPLSSTTVSLTAGTSLTSGTLTTGSQIALSLNNGFTFDPIRPPGGPTGTMTFTVSNGATTLGLLTLDGATSAIPAGATSNFTIPLAGTINSSSAITVTMTMVSPAGSAANPVAMNAAQPFTATATPTLNISQATVSIGAQSVNAAADTIDLSDIDSSIVRRIKDTTTNQGIMFLTIVNPFTVGGNMSLNFSAVPGSPAFTAISKAVVLPAAPNGTTPVTSTIPITFTGKELRTILAHKLLVAFGGNTAAGSLTVTPSQVISASARLQITAFIKEQ